MAAHKIDPVKALEEKDAEIARLQARIKAMDVTKPGMTEMEKADIAAMAMIKETRIAELEMALEAAHDKAAGLERKLAELDVAGKLSDGGTLDVQVIDALTGSVQVGDMQPLEVVTFARSVASFGKPGVLLVCKAGEAVQVSIMEKMRIVRRGSPDKPVHVLENVG